MHIPLNRSTQFTHLIGADLLLLTIWLKEFTQFTYLITAFSCLCPFHWRDSLSLHLWSQHSPVSVHFIEGIHSVYTFEQSSSSAFDHFIKGIHSVYTFWAEQFSCLSSFHGTDCLDLHIWSEQFSWHICFIERINAVRKFFIRAAVLSERTDQVHTLDLSSSPVYVQFMERINQGQTLDQSSSPVYVQFMERFDQGHARDQGNSPLSDSLNGLTGPTHIWWEQFSYVHLTDRHDSGSEHTKGYKELFFYFI